MIKASDIIQAAPKYLGTPYSKLDCQAFVEKCLSDAGLSKNLAGSNTWYREVRKNGWVGTPNECKKKYGSIPDGAFLFILSNNGKEPKQYQADGIGNASHIGLFTGFTGAEMCKMGNAPVSCNFGDGAIHSSSSRGIVCTSIFLGNAISGGWNRIGIYNQIDYGLEQKEEKQKMIGTVCAPEGDTVNMRVKPNTQSSLVERVPIGSQVEVESESGGWAYVHWNGKSGYMMLQFIYFLGEGQDNNRDNTVPVDKTWLEEMYKKIGGYLGK